MVYVWKRPASSRYMHANKMTQSSYLYKIMVLNWWWMMHLINTINGIKLMATSVCITLILFTFTLWCKFWPARTKMPLKKGRNFNTDNTAIWGSYVQSNDCGWWTIWLERVRVHDNWDSLGFYSLQLLKMVCKHSKNIKKHYLMTIQTLTCHFVMV